MRKHTKEFKSSISTFGRELDSKITVVGTGLILGKEDLFSITPITNSTLLKSVMKEVDFESKKQIGIGQEVNVKSGVKVNGEYEYIDYGNYSVYKSEYKAETDTYSHICYDKMLKTMIDYTPLDITYPINLREYINAIATKCGLEFADKNSTFANYNTSINEDHFSNGNYTFRDVLDYIAQLVGGWLCINDNDELEIRYPELAKNYDKVSGENVSFISNVEDEINTIIIDGKSTQATRSGKNLLSINSFTLVKGTSRTIQINFLTPIPAGTYTLSCKIKNKSGFTSSSGMSWALFDSSTSPATNRAAFTQIIDSTTSPYVSTKTTTGQSTHLYCYISQSLGDDATITLDEIMLESGSTATAFEPYGVMPSPDYPSEIESVGYENLFDGELELGYININTGVNVDTTNNIRTKNYIPIQPDKTYTLSSNISKNRYAIFYDSSKNYISYIQVTKASTSGTFTTPQNAYYIRWYDAVNADLTTQFQLEKGSVTHSYIPYGKYGIEVKNIGKNLLPYTQDFTETKNGSTFTGSKGIYTITTTPSQSTRFSNYDLIQPYTIVNGDYLHLFNDIVIDGSVVLIFSDNTSGYPSINATNKIFNLSNYVGKTITKISIDVKTTTTFTKLTIKPMIINSGTVTKYEPYKSNTTLIQLNEPLRSLPNGVKDELVIENGRAKIIKRVGTVVLDGSERWLKLQIGSTGKYYFQHTPSNLGQVTSNSSVLSNYFAQSTTWREQSVGIWFDKNLIIKTEGSLNNTETVDDFKTWLSTHNTQVDYELATPTEIDLGEVDTLSTFKGVNNVSLDTNIQTNMTITYPTEYEELDKHFLKDVNVSFSKKYGAVNSVVFSRGNGSDNIYRKDNASINKNGLTEIKIADNPFLEGDDRENFIQSLFDKINGLEFYIMDVASTGIMYLELGDLYYFNMVEEKPSLKSGLVKSGMRKAQGSSGGKFLCLLMNDEIKITQGLEESIYSDEPEITETDYKTASITDTSIKNAIIQTNKNSAEILLKVNSNEVVSAINLSPEKIKISSAKLDIDAIATFTNSKLAEAGSTVINGANITTGSINCDRLNGGTINGQAIRGGSISIQTGNYYFNMGTSTSNPNCSGLNVGGYGVKAYSDITATGFAITDGDTGKSQSINIYDGHGRVWYLTFKGGILTASEYK